MHLRSAPVNRWRFAALAALALLALLPRSALAQDNGGLGLDLSSDSGKKDGPAAAPVKPADSPPDTGPKLDDAPPTTSAPAGDKKQDLDVGEHDVSVDDRVKSVQHKGFYKKGHFELAPHVGVTVNDAFFTKYNLGGAAIFHFSDALALGLRADYMIVQTTENVPTAKRELQSRLPVSKPKYGGALDAYWTPIYGKASLFNSIIHFDLFAVAGVGAMVSQTSSADSTDENILSNPNFNQGPHPAFDIGVGQRYALNEVVAFEWQLLETLYTDTPGGTGSSQIQRVMSLNAGLSFFLPPVRSE
jgi:outer membrane beta-barrel protein